MSKTKKVTVTLLKEQNPTENPDASLDLFEHYHLLPQKVLDEIETFDEEADTYKECERLLKVLKPMGYTFEYGLDGEPYDLKKIQ